MEELQAQRDAIFAAETLLLETVGSAPPELEEYYHDLTTASGWQTRVKVWRRRQPATISREADATVSSSRPLVLLFHGGGFCVGSIEQPTRESREFALAFDAVVVSATYRLAPENHFLIFVNDAVDVAEWMTEHAAEELGADLSSASDGGFVVGGFSSGAQAAAMITSVARQRQWRFKPTGQFLGIPNLLGEEIVPQKYRHLWSSRSISDETMTPEILAIMLQLQGSDVRSPLYSPLNSPLGMHGLPRTYIQVGGKDPLRDDGVVFAKVLEDAGIDVRLHRYEELGHAGFTIGWEEATEPKGLKENTVKGLGWLLRREQALE